MIQLKYLGCLLLSVVCTLSFAQPPTNNPIFGGGRADGWSFNGIAQAGNPIYNGGHGDGWDRSGYALQTGNNIYGGGHGDGWSFTGIGEIGNNIYSGGNGDGWSMNSYAEIANNIYNGGRGDGWASLLRPAGPLPVSLLSFGAEKNEGFIRLNWVTVSEQNTGLFEIQGSINGRNFSAIGKVAAAGSGKMKKDYVFVDERPQIGQNLYRLKMIDLDGSITYSAIVLVHFDGKNAEIIAFPNPVTDWINLKLPQAYDRDIFSRIYDQQGKIVYQGYIPNGTLLHRLNIGHLPSGSYFIQVALPEGRRVIRIVR